MFEFSSYKLIPIIDNSWWAAQLLGIKDTAEKKLIKKCLQYFGLKLKEGWLNINAFYI